MERKRVFCLVLPVIVSITVLAPYHSTRANEPTTLAQRIRQIMARPEFAHSSFGIEFFSVESGKPLFALNEQQLFVPGSTTKLVTEGSALELLGGDYRFHTCVYRMGELKKNGMLKGDLVLVASGDPNLSNRIQSDGTLAFENEDHSYGGEDSKGLPGDPLLVIRELAQQIVAKGIKRVDGRVLVDDSLFPAGARELGTGVVISPIVVNDNLIDVIVSPGESLGAPVKLQVSPKTAYVQFVNQATTGAVVSPMHLRYEDEKANPDGTRSVSLTGSMPTGHAAVMHAYAVPEPSQYVATLLQEVLMEKGIQVKAAHRAPNPDFRQLAANYHAANLVAEHVSPAFSEDVKITLKVSQNLHASMTPYLLGALVAHKQEQASQAGFDVESDFLKKANLDLASASQGDGAGGNAFFTPDFVVRYLNYMRQQKDFQNFYRGLPILGRDGTLFKVGVNSPAAGHVHAKTGTNAAYNALNKGLMVTGKGLAGYMETASGQHLIFALCINMVPIKTRDIDVVQKIAGEALGEMATAAYDALLPESPAAAGGAEYDVIIRNGRIIDGSGNPWASGDIGIRGARIRAIRNLQRAKAKREIDASGMVVSPGFIDMLGQSEMALLIDNRSLSKLSQGITTEITGEGQSIAPQTPLTVAALEPFLDRYRLAVDWRDLDGYFERLEKTTSPLNIGTYVGAAQVRQAILGDVDRAPTPEEVERMKALVAQQMEQGAFGLSTALIYPPGHYAKTEELIALAKIAATYGGIYGTHMRSEGAAETQAVEEALQIGREAHIPVEIFHLKVLGKVRWGSMPRLVAMIQAARDRGQDVTANMYPYVAGETALASSLPPWVADGGTPKLLARLEDTAIRKRIKEEMAGDHSNWENLFLDSGGASGVVVAGVVNPDLKKFDGMTIAKIAAIEHKDPLDALFDFILADQAQTGALYFIASEQDLQYGLKQPWTSLCLDASELSSDGPLFEPHSHPRAFGSMPRFLGHYVRDQHLLPLEQAIRKMTSLPAQRVRLRERGLLKEGYFADITVFDPASIRDTATYDNAVQLSEGVKYVLVNGQLEYEDGKLTGVKAGKPLYGSGKRLIN